MVRFALRGLTNGRLRFERARLSRRAAIHSSDYGEAGSRAPSKLDASRVCPQPIHAVCPGKRPRGRSLLPAVPLVLLINKIVGHAGDVVTDDPRKRFHRGFLLVARW